MGKMTFKIGVIPGEMAVSQEKYADNFHAGFGYKMYEFDDGERLVFNNQLYTKVGASHLMPFEGGDVIEVSRTATVYKP